MTQGITRDGYLFSVGDRSSVEGEVRAKVAKGTRRFYWIKLARFRAGQELEKKYVRSPWSSTK